MDESFAVRLAARGYEVDGNGHITGSVLLQSGQHARWECLRAAGIDQSALLGCHVGPVSLEERIRFHRELRAGEDVYVTCRFDWTQRKTFRAERKISTFDGVLVAEITNVGGLLDLERRKLISDPASAWRAAAATPALLGL
jgi:acyl-CoA thioester hydrolase